MAKTSLRILAMNLENLFSPGQQFYGSTYTAAEYQNKVEWIGSMIARTQVHVAALTELGEDEATCLNDVVDAANAQDTTGWTPFNHDFRGDPGGSSTRIRSAVISRFPLTDTESLTTYPQGFKVDLLRPGTNPNSAQNWIEVPSTEFSRPVAKVRVNPPNGGKSFNLFVVHLKSKRPKKASRDGSNESIGIARSAIQRNVEAAALRYYFDSFLPAQYQSDRTVATLVAGDFNDTPTSVPLENIRGPFDSRPGPASTWSNPDKLRLISCARLHLKKAAYEDKLFSYVYNESFTLIDQVFVTQHLPGRFVRMETYNDHVFRHHDLSSSTPQEQQWKSRVSDHGVVAVEFVRMLK